MDKHESTKAAPDAGLVDALDLTTNLPPNGYVWWYVDALSDDGGSGLTLIAFIGSVFSPYYALARRKGDVDPENHIALNIALYGKGGKRWAMTDRGRSALARTRLSLRIGPSQVVVDGGSLCFDVEEWSVPLPSRLRGRVRVTPLVRNTESFTLDEAGWHRWCPIAPRCRVEVEMEKPGRRWEGDGYLDSNRGDRPLETDFSYWDWSRLTLGDRTAILYDVIRQDGSEQSLGLTIDRAGAVTRFEPPPRVDLLRNTWRVPRRTQSEGDARVLQTFEDTPFYSRSMIQTRLFGESVTGMHESLSLDRFRNPIVQLMLPFRMPRRSR